LGISANFDVDLPAVERAHRELSRALHPDRYVTASASERRTALAKAIEVNEAWRVVRDPIRRAEALLTLRGVRVDDAAARGELPAEFLAKMMDLREALAEARASRNLDAVRSMAAEVEARARSSQQELASGFVQGRGATLLTPLAELRFYERFLDEVGAIEDDLVT
jgi:molecular chaperone HscB